MPPLHGPMFDAFALFHLPRQPWLEADALKEAFQRGSAARHPDANGDAAQFTDWNRAYQLLRDPAARLRHLLELEQPELLQRTAPIPAAVGTLFMEIGALQQSVERLLGRARAASSLARAVLADEALARADEVKTALQRIEEREAELANTLQASGLEWRSEFATLTEIVTELAYLQKWSSQLREARLQLELAR